jgi:hypothetical protein
MFKYYLYVYINCDLRRPEPDLFKPPIIFIKLKRLTGMAAIYGKTKDKRQEGKNLVPNDLEDNDEAIVISYLVSY